MPSFAVPDPNATAKININGLAACCFNSAFTERGPSARVGRWEVALPHVPEHQITIGIRELGISLNVSRSVKKIEIKNRVAVEVDNPKHMVGETFDRRVGPTQETRHDYRWLTDFTNRTEIPHVMPTMVPRSAITMLYVYDSTFYTDMDGVINQMTLADHEDTGLIIGDRIEAAPEHHAGPALDRSPNFGFAATSILIDVHHLGIVTPFVDIFFDDSLQMSIGRAGAPRTIQIENLEDDDDDRPRPEGSVINTVRNRYGRGDFFRYYRFFSVPDGSSKFHLWERRNRTQQVQPQSAIEGDCNGVRVDAYPNLDGLL